MAYTPPPYNAVDADLAPGYTPPPYNAVDADLASSGRETIQVSLVQYYDIKPPYATAILVQPYAITSLVYNVSLEQIYSLQMSATLIQRYDDAPLHTGTLVQWYDDAHLFRAALEQPYSDAYTLFSMLEQPYTIYAMITAALEQPYTITGAQPYASLAQPYSIRDVNELSASLIQMYALLPPAILVQTVTTAKCAGADIDLHHINIEASRTRYCLSCELHLSRQTDYVRCKRLDDLEVTINGQVFVFFVESKTRNRGYGTAEYVLNGLSPAALLDRPYADDIETTENGISGLASAIAATLSNGHTLAWNTVDWHIPEFTLYPNGRTPLELIRDIAAAAGAVIQSAPDGSISVEPFYPYPPHEWQGLAPAVVLSDTTDFFTTSEDYDHRSGHNKYLITDNEGLSNQLQHELEDRDDNTKYLRVYSIPWDATATAHTGGDWVILTDDGIETRLVENEMVEFVSGTGHTRHPVVSVESSRWAYADLGSVAAEYDGVLTSEVAAESLLYISYYTQCHRFIVADPVEETVQIVTTRSDA